MPIFIVFVLLCAWLQSLLKLALLPRFFRYAVPVALLPLPFLLQDRLATYNFREFSAFLANPDHLRDLCTVLVIQELFSLLAGASLLGDLETGRRSRFWKYLALAPSLLVPAGMVLLQLALFNFLLKFDFQKLTFFTAFGSVIVLAGGAELVRKIMNDSTQLMSAALNGSWLLLILAVFLPVAIDGRLVKSPFEIMTLSDLLPIIAMLAVVVLSMFVIGLIKKYKRKRKST